MRFPTSASKGIPGLWRKLDTMDPPSVSGQSPTSEQALRDEIARLRLEVWELRDAMQGLASYERSAEHLMHENYRLMYLVRRPWRTARIASQSLRGKVRRRYVSWRSPN